MEKLKIYSQKIIDLTFTFDDYNKVVFRCDLIDFYVHLCYYYYFRNIDKCEGPYFVYTDEFKNRFVIDTMDEKITIKNNAGKVLLNIKDESEKMSFDAQMYYILFSLKKHIFNNYELTDILTSKFLRIGSLKDKYLDCLEKIIVEYKNSEIYFLKNTAMRVINIGAGWARILFRTENNKMIDINPGYITCVPGDLLELFIEFLSNDNANKIIEFEEEPGNPQFLIHDNKLFFKEDYDAEEVEVLGSKLELATCVYNDIGKNINAWVDDFHSFNNNEDLREKVLKDYIANYNKLGELIKSKQV